MRKKAASDKPSLTRSRRTSDQEQRGVKGSEARRNSVMFVTSLPKEKCDVPDKTTPMGNRIAVSLKASNGERFPHPVWKWSKTFVVESGQQDFR